MNFAPGQKITIARRAIYAGSHSSEREYEKIITEYREIEGQSAALISVKSAKGGNTVIRGRLEGNFINVYYPRAARYEIVS